MVKEVQIKNLGIVKITKKRGAKHLRLSVRPHQQINLTIPYSVSYDYAISFIKEKYDWIIRIQKKLAASLPEKKVFSPKTSFQTKSHQMIFIKSDRFQIKITKHLIKVEYSDENEVLSEEGQSYIRIGITEALRIEAKSYLPQRTDFLAQKYGFKFESLSVRNASSRWGSCSGKNTISLNIQLMRLPDYLIDYVILHELCHTVEKNHGSGFWALLDKVTGKAKLLDKELKQYRTEF